jgi:hypothetical protein
MSALRARLSVLLAAAAFAAGCVTTTRESSDRPSANPPPSTPVPRGASATLPLARFRTEPRSFTQQSGFRDPTHLVIRDRAAWLVAWTALHAGQDSIPPLPVVEFDRELIVLAALGAKPTGGHEIVIASAVEQDGAVVIQLSATAPGQDCMTTQAITTPADVARIPRVAATIGFDLVTTVKPCGP